MTIVIYQKIKLFKGSKHIAISFLLMFIVPIIYQPIHIIQHHSHKKCDGNHSAYQTKNDSRNSGLKKINHCYICEFEFTVTDLPNKEVPIFSEICFSELIIASEQNSFNSISIHLVCPRAPPCIS